MSMPSERSPSARVLRRLTAVEPVEVRAVLLSMLYFLFLFGSYSIVKPVRDSMGTVYGMDHLQELFTATFAASFVFSPLYAWLASRMKLSTFLPWVYGFIALTILAFGALYSAGSPAEHWIAAGFYVWVSTFNLLIISVFWTFHGGHLLARAGEAAVWIHCRRRHHRRHRGARLSRPTSQGRR